MLPLVPDGTYIPDLTADHGQEQRSFQGLTCSLFFLPQQVQG
jgi:hypothetical protein